MNEKDDNPNGYEVIVDRKERAIDSRLNPPETIGQFSDVENEFKKDEEKASLFLADCQHAGR